MGKLNTTGIHNYQMLIVSALLGGVAALWLGFELDWDLLNYHLYNPHALLTGRSGVDFAVAQQQGFLNPTLYIPVYLAFKYLPAWVLVFIVGAIQGGQILLIYLIAEKVVVKQVPRLSLLVVAILGCLGPVFLGQLGATPADTILSALVLAGLLLVLGGLEPERKARIGRIGLFAGVLLGVAVALKLTMAIYAVALGIVLLFGYRREGQLHLVLSYATGAAVGFLLAGGVWFLHLWLTYGNPLFPYFNSIFESPWIETASYRDVRFMPKSMLERLIYPYLWFNDPHRVWEMPFRDIRVLLLYPVMFLLPLLRWKFLGQKAPALRILLVFLGLSYILWISVFSIYRYLAVVEMLAAVALFASVVAISDGKKWVVLVLMVLVASQFLVDFSRQPTSWQLDPETQTALSGLAPDSMLIIDSYEPLAYLALWVPENVPIIRIRANFMNPDNDSTPLAREAARRVDKHQGRYYLLNTSAQADQPFMTRDLERVGLSLTTPENCKPVFMDEELQKKLTPVICELQELNTPARGFD